MIYNVLKVKHPLREPHVELLGLPVGEYVVRVRCRSHNYGLWSKWSSTLLMSIPARPPAGTPAGRGVHGNSGGTMITINTVLFYYHDWQLSCCFLS